LKKSKPKFFLLGVLTLAHLYQASLVRPVADDYTLLRVYSFNGFNAFISFFWNNFGGNITPAVIRGFFLSISLDGSNWFGFIAYSLITSVLVVSAYLVLISWLTKRKLRNLSINDILISFIASLSFEGLFTPGLSSAYLFGAASGVHLWPVCIFIIGTKLICVIEGTQLKWRAFLVLPCTLVIGFQAGNSGIAEGLVVFFVLIWLLSNQNSALFPEKISTSKGLVGACLMGVTIGLSVTFFSPGFSARNIRVGKFDDGLVALLINFRSALVNFSGELLTHPVWIVIFLIISLRSATLKKIDIPRAKFMFKVFVLYFITLIFGSTFGYSAWHQSSGLIFLIAPGMLSFLAYSHNTGRNKIPLNTYRPRIAIAFAAILLTSMTARGLIVQEIRKSSWEQNLVHNYCALNRVLNPSLQGAEIKYWPMGLGVEDVNSWAWMAKDYSAWVMTFNPKFDSKCN
jgi:hypothetical protein